MDLEMVALLLQSLALPLSYMDGRVNLIIIFLINIYDIN